MMRALVALLALLVVACGSPLTFPHHASADFTADERASILRGLSFLREHTGRDLDDVVFDLPAGDRTCAHGNIIREARDTGGLRSDDCIYLGTGEGAVPLDALTAHEMGHWWGLRHVEQPGSLMFGAPPTLAWTEADARECKRDGLCR